MWVSTRAGGAGPGTLGLTSFYPPPPATRAGGGPGCQAGSQPERLCIWSPSVHTQGHTHSASRGESSCRWPCLKGWARQGWAGSRDPAWGPSASPQQPRRGRSGDPAGDSAVSASAAAPEAPATPSQGPSLLCPPPCPVSLSSFPSPGCSRKPLWTPAPLCPSPLPWGCGRD